MNVWIFYLYLCIKILDRLQCARGKCLLLVFVHTTRAEGWPEATAGVPSCNSRCFTPWLPKWTTNRWGCSRIYNFSYKQGAERDGGAPVWQAGLAPPLPPQWYTITPTEHGCCGRASWVLGYISAPAAEPSPQLWALPLALRRLEASSHQMQ